MKAFRITALVVFSLVCLYSVYATIGYLVLGIQTPNIVGNTTTHFTGMFIMSGVFFVVTIICIVLIVILAKKIRKMR